MKVRSKIPVDQLYRSLFLLIYISTVVLYVTVLLTSQSHVDGDEGVIGIMARHIITRKQRPIFFYGQAYGGGAALEAYLAVIPFALFGASSVSLKVVALCMSLLTLILTYFFSKRYLNAGVALVSVAIFAVATPLVEWHTKMRGGYAGLLLSIIAILFLYARIAYNHKTYWLNFLAIGLLCGLAYYNKALILSLLVALILACASWRKTFWNWKSIILFILGFIGGAAPLIKYELANNFTNTRFVFGLGSNRDTSILLNIVELLTGYLPSFFVGRNVDQYVAKPPVQAWIEYLLYAGLFGYVLYKNRDSLRAIFTAWLPGIKTIEDQNPPKPESILVLAVLIHLVVCAISKNTALSPRYFLPLFPILAVLAGSAIEDLWQKRSKIIKVMAMLTFIVLIGSGLITHVGYIRPSTVTDDVLLTDGRIVNLQTTGKAAISIIDFLHTLGISNVRSAYFIQWRIIFESQETIIASSNGFVPGLSRFREYDEQVDQAQQIAYVFHKDSAQLQDFSDSPAAAQLVQNQIYEYVIYYPTSE